MASDSASLWERWSKITANVDISAIKGNASDETKALLAQPYGFEVDYSVFVKLTGLRVKVLEVSILPNAEEPSRQEAKVVSEIVVESDMLNGGGNIHGGCSAFLIDWCTSQALIAYSMHTTGAPRFGVSQSLNTIYHSPATVGDRLVIVSRSVSVGSRAISGRAEIWNATHHRLVVSGVHVKVEPSEVKAAKL